jgi:hypothetical protein
MFVEQYFCCSVVVCILASPFLRRKSCSVAKVCPCPFLRETLRSFTFVRAFPSGSGSFYCTVALWAIVAVTKLHASRSREHFVPLPCASKSPYSVASFAELYSLVWAPLFILQSRLILLWPWSMQFGDGSWRNIYKCIRYLIQAFRFFQRENLKCIFMYVYVCVLPSSFYT